MPFAKSSLPVNADVKLTRVAEVKLTHLGEDVSLTFVKVIDELRYGLVEDGEPIAEPTDRGYWEQRSNKASLSIVDSIFDAINPIESSTQL